jgi:hypothetical protein
MSTILGIHVGTNPKWNARKGDQDETINNMQNYGSSLRAVCTSLMILGVPLYTDGAYSQEAKEPAAEAKGRAQFEPASVTVAAGSNCILHPEGNQDPKESLHVNADEDGVARFLAVRATGPNSVEKLALDCTDADKRTKTYSVDLRDEATFKPHPFDASRTMLAVRPALTGDPHRMTQEELVKAGYGLRPDATENPEAYQRWLAAASRPMHRLRTDRTIKPFPISRQRELKRAEQAPALNAKVYKSPSSGWTGAILQGSYEKKATAADTISYGSNEAMVVVPNVTPGPTAAMTIWNGLDNVFQAIVDVNSTPTTASFGIHRQSFDPHNNAGDEAGTRFTPAPGDHIYIEEWYCDAKGALNLDGGYECTLMIDMKQDTMWECDQAESSDCPSYKLDKADLGNGKVGWWAEYIIEDDTDEVVKGSEEWPIFSPVTMSGSANVITGNGTKGSGKLVATNTDPLVEILTDNNKSSRHLVIALPKWETKWTETECSAKDKWDATSGECIPRSS